MQRFTIDVGYHAAAQLVPAVLARKIEWIKDELEYMLRDAGTWDEDDKKSVAEMQRQLAALSIAHDVFAPKIIRLGDEVVEAAPVNATQAPSW